MRNLTLLVPLAALALLAGCAAASFDPEVPARVSLPPAPDGVAHATAAFSGHDGVRLFEQSWRPQGPTPTAAALAIIHGLKDHSSRYAPLAAELARRGVAVYAADLRGHARSEGDRVWVDEFLVYVSDADLFIRLVREREPGRPIFVMGHSMGGAIATTLVLDRKPKIDGLILSAPALSRGNVSSFLVGLTKMFGAIAPSLAVFDLDLEKFSRDPKEVEALRADPLVDQGKGPARTAAELVSAIDAIGERMEEVAIPLLILHGKADEVTDPEGSKELARRAKSADKTLELYDKAYHDLWHEPEREVVAKDVIEWIEARARRTPAN